MLKWRDKMPTHALWMTGGLMLLASTLSAQEPAKPAADMPKGDMPKGDMPKADMPKAAKGAKPMSDDALIKHAMKAGPTDISKDATIVTMGDDMKMRQLKAGTNGWVCMAKPEAMCMDKEWQGWAEAWMAKKDPQVKGVGIAYMLRGDQGASNTDPFATAATADNHWIVSPAHIMVLSPDTKLLDSLPTDPNTGGPWVMWKGTKYAHIMVPTVPMPAKKTAAAAK